MISNHKPARYSRQAYSPQENDWEPRPRKIEDTLDRGEVQIDHKVFQLTLKENNRGRFLRIVENNRERVESIILPSMGLADFFAVLGLMVEANQEFPPAIGSLYAK